jgi:hypothetical protein
MVHGALDARGVGRGVDPTVERGENRGRRERVAAYTIVTADGAAALGAATSHSASHSATPNTTHEPARAGEAHALEPLAALAGLNALATVASGVARASFSGVAADLKTGTSAVERLSVDGFDRVTVASPSRQGNAAEERTFGE